jgi:glutamate N-acetyltransferase/amino-acid N-acetyltransferase
MPNAPINPPKAVPGFSVAGISCGIKSAKDGIPAPDLTVITCDRPASYAAVFTQNVVRAAPVLVSEALLDSGVCQAIVANSGNANACTGATGMTDAQTMTRLTAEALGIPQNTVAVASTGVIGQTLPMDKINAGIAKAVSALSPDGWQAAAEAICTTDLVPKWHSVEAKIAGHTVHMTGIAKGSGMIHPNMATMLGFVACDANIGPAALQTAVSQAVSRTFNRITVDGDTSTNDCVLTMASRYAGSDEILENSPEWETLVTLLEEVCGVLARAIVADGEGATKLVTVTVEGTETEDQAEAMARQIAMSSLVKTALFAADPNWGRVLAAAGQAGIPFNPDHATLHFDNHCLYAAGAWQGEQAEQAVGEVMAGDTYTITLAVGNGPASATIWTCDLSYDYVRINAEYRT